MRLGGLAERAGVIFERVQATDDFIASVVAQWLAGLQADSSGQG